MPVRCVAELEPGSDSRPVGCSAEPQFLQSLSKWTVISRLAWCQFVGSVDEERYIAVL